MGDTPQIPPPLVQMDPALPSVPTPAPVETVQPLTEAIPPVRQDVHEVILDPEKAYAGNRLLALMNQELGDAELAGRYLLDLEQIAKFTNQEFKEHALMNWIERHSPHTRVHQERVESLADRGAEYFADVDMKAVALGMRLHDIGKAGVPKDVVDMPGKYGPEHYRIVAIHPLISGYALRYLGFDPLLQQIAFFHHIRPKVVEGRLVFEGYPTVADDAKLHEELARAPFPKEVVIGSMFDVYEALTSETRPTKRLYTANHSEAASPYTPLEALELMENKIFNDPYFSDAFAEFKKAIHATELV